MHLPDADCLYHRLYPVRIRLVPGAMKTTTKVFIAAELLDILTTRINLSLPGFYEANPFMAGIQYWLIVKIIGTIAICLLLERLDFRKFIIIVPIAASIPPIWNIGLLIYYLVR